MADTLTIYYQNCRGTRGKLQTIYMNILSNSYDIIVLTESWLIPDIADCEIIDERYNVFRCDRDRAATGKLEGGGVLVAILRTLQPIYFTNIIGNFLHTHIEYLLIQLPSNDHAKRHFISAVYIPPNTPDNIYSTYLDLLSTILSNPITHCFYIIGDFNLPTLDWSSCDSATCDQPREARSFSGRYLENFIAEFNATQYHNFTNINNRTLDLLISNEHCHVYQPSDYLVPVDPLHPPYCAVTSPYLKYSPMKRCPIIKFNYNKGNYDLIKADLSEIDWNSLLKNLPAQESVNTFYNSLYGTIRKNVPQKLYRTSKFPIWFTRPLIRLFKNKNNAWIKWKVYNNISDYEQFSLFRRRFNKECYLCHSNYIKTVEQNVNKNLKHFWGYVDSKRSNSGIPSNIKYKNTSSSDPRDICKLFSNYFQSVYEPLTLDIHKWQPPSSFNDNSDIINNINIKPSKVYRELRSLDPSKGPGPDGIPPSFFKRVANHLCEPLHLLFNKCISEGVFPDVWKIAHLTPVFKKGSKNDVENYRPISILSTLSKLFERLVYNEIYPTLHKAILQEQHGFVQQRSTYTNLLIFVGYVFENMDSRLQTDAVYTDFQKAFDKVDHELLLRKIAFNGIRGNLLRWFSSYITNRTQKVAINGFQSELISVTSGVPQGSILGPLLFTLFINDISVCFKHSNFLLYADDLKVYKTIKSIDDCLMLQSDLDRLSSYCTLNKLSLSLAKCNSITFTKNKKQHTYSYHLLNTQLKRVYLLRDLGVVLDSKFHFNIHVENIINKALKMYGFVMRNSKDFKRPSTYRYLYISLVRPCLEFATIIWNPYYAKYIDSIETVQRKFLRALHYRCYHSHGSHDMLLNNYKLLTLESRRLLLGTMFLHRIVHNKYDCSELINKLCYIVPRTVVRRQTRPYRLLSINIRHVCNSNAGFRAPLRQLVDSYNSRFENIDIFNLTDHQFRKSVVDSILAL